MITIEGATSSQEQIVSAINESWLTMIETEERRPPAQPRTYLYASGFRDCERRMFLEATHAHELPPFDTQTLAKFRRGNDRERDLALIQLVRVGQYSNPQFTIERQQDRVELRDRKGRAAIVGRVDGFIRLQSHRIPFEVKSWNFNLTQNMYTFGDVLAGKWTRSGAFQLLSYLYGFECPLGLFILDRPGLPRLIPVSFMEHLSEMEEFLLKAERILDHIEAGTAPEFHDDPAVCRECPLFGELCNPPISYGAGAQVILDEDVIQLLERREQLKDVAKEFEQIDAKLKKRYRGLEMGIAGNYLLRGKWSANTVYEIPPDIKRAYKRVDPQGKFSLSISNINSTSTDTEV